jgi:hypothetical protein
MKFEYNAILSLAPDTGEPMVIFRPEVRLRIHGANGSEEFLALLDTGADNTILPESIARDLEIPLTPCKGPAATAFGGQEISLSYGNVDLELVHPEGNLRWTLQVYFVAGDSDKETLILGHQGFLEFFTATFNGEEFSVVLEANGFLPRVG